MNKSIYIILALVGILVMAGFGIAYFHQSHIR